MSNPAWLERAAAQSSARSWTLGRVLDRYREIESVSEAELAAELGCVPATLKWLALCRAPSGVDFAHEIDRVADRFSLDSSGLAAVLRRVEVVDAFSESAGRSEVAEDPSLLAARDREEDH